MYLCMDYNFNMTIRRNVLDDMSFVGMQNFVVDLCDGAIIKTRFGDPTRMRVDHALTVFLERLFTKDDCILIPKQLFDLFKVNDTIQRFKNKNILLNQRFNSIKLTDDQIATMYDICLERIPTIKSIIYIHASYPINHEYIPVPLYVLNEMYDCNNDPHMVGILDNYFFLLSTYMDC